MSWLNHRALDRHTMNRVLIGFLVSLALLSLAGAATEARGNVQFLELDGTLPSGHGAIFDRVDVDKYVIALVLNAFSRYFEDTRAFEAHSGYKVC